MTLDPQMRAGINGARVGVRNLREFLTADGPPLTTRQLAQLIGMSLTFVRKEIRAGEVRACVLGHGRKRVFRIPRPEARRYLRQLGLI